MNRVLLHILDCFFLLFHTAWSVFNSAGWMHPRTRKIQLVTVSLTAASWFILGIWYGWGFCPCTEWHWQMREALGNPVQSGSYIHFLIREITGIDLPSEGVDTAVLVIFIASALAGIAMNARDWLRKRG